MPTDRDIDEPDRADEDDNTFEGFARRLGSVGRIIEKSNSRLTAINDGLDAAHPPDPIKPQLGAALDTIESQIADATALVGQLREKVVITG